ncbi:nucleotidyltransferase family protein [Helicovermis profundi]|uniref:Nucleotidyltransferase family protein n=1 Tax=Helicovermis profundi TaxID=3065157 RepID=A0AAU9ENV9_9FIRM|nr:hypothetical protein HLPR_04810 [Clostridia bacterium S502]
MFTTLSIIADKLNEANITWAIGSSMVLCIHGLVDKPNDIDIIISLDDIEKADIILKSLGTKSKWEKSASYSSRYFYEYVINGIDIDVISGLRINLEKEVFEYNFDKSSITKSHIINGISIPMTSLEEWYLLYQLMKNREAKVAMIEKYLSINKSQHISILKKMLEQNIPENIKKRVLKLIDSY